MSEAAVIPIEAAHRTGTDEYFTLERTGTGA